LLDVAEQCCKREVENLPKFFEQAYGVSLNDLPKAYPFIQQEYDRLRPIDKKCKHTGTISTIESHYTPLKNSPLTKQFIQHTGLLYFECVYNFCSMQAQLADMLINYIYEYTRQLKLLTIQYINKELSDTGSSIEIKSDIWINNKYDVPKVLCACIKVDLIGIINKISSDHVDYKIGDIKRHIVSWISDMNKRVTDSLHGHPCYIPFMRNACKSAIHDFNLDCEKEWLTEEIDKLCSRLKT
jgi:hypothetical protein